MSDKVIIDKDWLSARMSEGLTPMAIGELIHTSETTVGARQRELGLYKPSNTAKRDGPWHSEEWLYQRRMVERMEIRDIAKLAGCAYATIQYELARRHFGQGYLDRQERVDVAPVDIWNLPDLDCLNCRRHRCNGCPLDVQC
jgi:hypothetical protein